MLLSTLEAEAQRFAAIGDYGSAGRAEQDVAKLVKSWNPEFIITLGDNNYNIGDSMTIDQNIGQYYHEYIRNYKGHYGPSASTNRFFPSLGNHDLYTTNGQPYLDYFTLPGNERYYDFVEGDVHFFVLNSGPIEPDGLTSTSTQAQWLQQRLAASKALWNVVYFHHAPYSSGAHGSTKYMQWPFKEWGASVVLTGHDHHYERLLVDDFPYFVNGLGGKSLYPIRDTPLPESQIAFNDNYGAMLISAAPDTMAFQFFTRSGKLIDSYVLRKPLSPQLELYPPVPNPVRDVARIEVSAPADMNIRLRVLDVLGREVVRLHDGPIRIGRHAFSWSRGKLASGLYFLQLTSNGHSQVQRLEAL